MPENRNIRYRYRDIIEDLANRYGTEASGYEIPRNIELKKCIGYTIKYIVKGDRIH